MEDLERARINCLAATQAEQGYQILSRVCHNLANAYLARMDYAKAKELFKQTVYINGDEYNQVADAFNGLGVSLAHQRKLSEAEYNFRQAIKYNPTYINLDRTDEAIAEFGRAIELDPQFASPHNNLVIAYWRLEKIDDAIAEFQRAIELDPEFAPPRYYMGLACNMLGRTKDAADGNSGSH